MTRGCGAPWLRCAPVRPPPPPPPNDTVIHEGELSTLKRFKDEVNEGARRLPNAALWALSAIMYLQKGDLIECFTVEEIERKL